MYFWFYTLGVVYIFVLILEILRTGICKLIEVIMGVLLFVVGLVRSRVRGGKDDFLIVRVFRVRVLFRKREDKF